MNHLSKVVLAVIFIGVFLVLIYQQIEIERLKHPQPLTTPQPTSSPTLPLPSYPPTTSPSSVVYTEIPSTIVTTDLVVSQYRSDNETYLLIEGTVANESPNTLYDVGLQVYSYGFPSLGALETLIDITVPIATGSYYNYEKQYTLTTMSPNENIPVTIKIHPGFEYRSPTLYGNNVTVVTTNLTQSWLDP
jgi:hypothetical protein